MSNNHQIIENQIHCLNTVESFINKNPQLQSDNFENFIKKFEPDFKFEWQLKYKNEFFKCGSTLKKIHPLVMLNHNNQNMIISLVENEPYLIASNMQSGKSVEGYLSGLAFNFDTEELWTLVHFIDSESGIYDITLHQEEHISGLVSCLDIIELDSCKRKFKFYGVKNNSHQDTDEYFVYYCSRVFLLIHNKKENRISLDLTSPID
jgi:hypothetical protein